MRGRWLLANMLGAPPPPPPPDIPALKDAGVDGQPRSLRERMEMHRKNPACASCHQRMDPLGFCARELRRASANGARPATARRSIRRRRSPTARGSRASPGCARCWSSHKEDFVRTLSGKLLAYAIGRGLDYHDMPAVREIARDAAPADYSWSSIITGIVKSTPFSMAVASGEATKTSVRRGVTTRKGTR